MLSSLRPFSLAMAVFVLALAGVSLASAAEVRHIETIENADYFGFDLRTEKDVSLQQCEAICLNDRECRAFTYNTRAGWCFLKSDHGTVNPFDGAVAGRVVVERQEDLGAPPPLAFIPDSMPVEARTYREQLDATAKRLAGRNPAFMAQDGFAALSGGDARKAVTLLSGAVALTMDDSRLWSALARGIRAMTPDRGSERYKLQQFATSAAYNAYETSRTTPDRAEALNELAKALELRSQFRPALEAYKASLALAEDEQVRADYADLRARKGFRVVDNTVDADTATPRACLQLSENLVKGVDYAPYIRLNGGEAPAFDAQGREICINGLKHGERYAVTLRDGLPSAVGEVLEAPVDISVYVRDRAPFARFTGEAFVLPAKGRQAIPVVTVNAPEVELQLYRIGERALAQLTEDGKFLQNLSGYQADEIMDRQGNLVWSGAMETPGDLNQEVTTALPLDTVLPDRKPGVYALVARAKGDTSEDWNSRATQWFTVSDIGLSAQSGLDGLTVFARSLDSATPLAGAKVRLIARNNEVLGEGVSDADGVARFDAGLIRGTGGLSPSVLVAEAAGAGFVFLDLTKAGFDLSDRGVEGRPAPGAIDVYAFTERGIYRAGDTVHVTALARDGSANAVESLPLTFIFQRPDGVEDRRMVSASPKAGGHVIDLPLPDNAMRGAWTVRIHADPKETALAEQTFLVEDFVPDRIEFDLASASGPVLDPNEGGAVSVTGRFLYGAPAAGLSMEGEVQVSPVSNRPGHDGYIFGMAEDDDSGRTTVPLQGLPVLDDAGQAEIGLDLGTLPSTTRPLEATVTIRMREGAGRAVERSLSLPIKPMATMIGVKPGFADGQAPEGATVSFNVIAVDRDGAQVAAQGLSWRLLRVTRNYQWYRDGSSWRYEAADFTSVQSSGTVDASAATPATIDMPVEWGRYRLEVEGADAITSYDFHAGWYVETSSLDTPDGLEIALDKDGYKPGETARLKVSPRFAGELLVTVGSDRVLATKRASVPADGAEIEIPVGDDWGAGAYVTATLYRPGSAGESRMPARAIGVKWLGVDVSARTLDVALDLAAQTVPNQAFEVPLTVTGAKEGETVFATVAAVDVGILNLTGYQPPKPEEWYYGQRRMGLEIRDVYGRLIDGSQGALGHLRTGGDGPGMQSKGSPPKGKLVAFFSGPVRVGADGKAVVRFDMPQFNGTVRVMATAWSATATGSATRDVIVREPVVVIAGTPRFMATGDRSELRFDIANTDGPTGDYAVTVETSGPLTLAGDLPGKVVLGKGARTVLRLPVSAGAPGAAGLTLTLAHANDVRVVHDVSFPVRPGALPVTVRREIELLANGGSLTVDRQLLADSVIRDASVSVAVTRLAAFDIPGLLMSLDRYPYGCAEQTTSRALPLLYLSDLEGEAADPEIDKRIDKAIARVLAYQSSSGSFGLWSPGSGDLWLDAYVSDFLTRAQEKGFKVPQTAMQLALGNLENNLAYVNDVSERGREIAYALYVLARNRKASAGDLRYYADTKLDAFDSPMARAQLAASLSLYGDGDRSARLFRASLDLAEQQADQAVQARDDYGSKLRDGAAILALAAESKPEPAGIREMTRFVANQKRHRPYTSTQEEAWMLLAARALATQNAAMDLTVNGTDHAGAFTVRRTGIDLVDAPITVKNNGAEPVTAVVTSVAAPVDPLPAGGNGFTIARSYFTLDGKPASLQQVAQNQRLVVVLQIAELNTWPSRIVVTDLLPAGFEIDNPALTGSAQLSNFEWLGNVNPAHLEFLDDRFVAAFNRSAGDSRTLQLAYVVRAVTPGAYVHPAAQVEDMYRPQFSAHTSTGYVEVVEAR
ncbi:hypothetical protein CSC94_08185 [Zhengella mangrovi]|uniref:Apple domain-containing protein n=1 Tax=Zhengella mangrovi TaxID=1982044 RepID=A0A2G1QQ59_9HYPH|nr:alpha-2-macroglobulin family protein [Zhengella mangrovi]PHP67666.1 hypothetical protein CSC94_08185 [Zhengella mangrovi]